MEPEVISIVPCALSVHVPVNEGGWGQDPWQQTGLNLQDKPH